MRQREPIRRHRGQAVRDGEGKDVRQETACGGLGSASWCLDENGVGTPCPSSRGIPGRSCTYYSEVRAERLSGGPKPRRGANGEESLVFPRRFRFRTVHLFFPLQPAALRPAIYLIPPVGWTGSQRRVWCVHSSVPDTAEQTTVIQNRGEELPPSPRLLQVRDRLNYRSAEPNHTCSHHV